MGTDKNPLTNANRRTAVILSGLIALAIVFAAVNTLAAFNQSGSATNQQDQPADRTLADYINAHTISFGSYDAQGRYVAFDNYLAPTGGADVEWSGNTMQQGSPSSSIAYTLTLHNNTGITDTYNIISSTLWAVTLSGNVITIPANSNTELLATVEIPSNVSNLQTNISVLTATAQSDSMIYATVNLTSTAVYGEQFLPLITAPIPSPDLTATRPNSQNDWELQWESIAGLARSLENIEEIDGYELQESQDATFATVLNTFNLGAAATAQLIDTHNPSPNNVYYYRLRATAGSQFSDWSNVVQVNGAYLDEFTDPSTGWARRRVTHIDETTTFYEIEDDKDWLIVQSLDSWDWVIASPLKPAPEPPYVIEYRIKHANLGNLVSHGFVFGGDWNGGLCPDTSSVEGWYQHTACFNHFYDTNTIWFADLKLLFERVDQLVWCPNCGGSPMKRLGDIEGNPDNVPLLNNVDPDDWNTFQIEVRENSIKFFANGALQSIIDGSQEYDDTRYIDSPYFGIIATTDEYSNSTARVEYVKITPLDN